MALWIAQGAVKAALKKIVLLKAHAQTPVILAMKLAGVNDTNYVEFASNSDMRAAFFDKYFAPAEGAYYNPFIGTLHNTSYPHGSQYTVAREVRKPRWRNSLDWQEPAGRSVDNYNVKFNSDYIESFRAEMTDGQPLPVWPFAVIFQAFEGAVPESIDAPSHLVNYWSKKLHVTDEERGKLFDVDELPSEVSLLSSEELDAATVRKIMLDFAERSNRGSRPLGKSPRIAPSSAMGAAADVPLNLILYGPPGTGKTRSFLTEYAPHFMNTDGTQRFVVTTFHPSYYYEDFIEGLRPEMIEGEDGRQVGYSIVPGVFKRICSEAESDQSNSYAIFIDEINRGKIDALFGDVITLLDSDKRGGLSVVLPYSKEEFSVPSNLHIIGSMNTADRSIALLDVALRRRFVFREIPPSSDTLTEMLEDAGITGGLVDGVSIPRLMEALNKRLEFYASKDQLIGHGWFSEVRSLNDLIECFHMKIIPLLEEYFHGDERLVVEVLLDDTSQDFSFFRKQTLVVETSSGRKSKEVYRVNEPHNWTAQTFAQLCGDVDRGSEAGDPQNASI